MIGLFRRLNADGLVRQYISGAAIVIFVLLSAIGASKPLHLDNMDFPAVAEQTAQTGIPVYYHGEETPQGLGLYHPPLYIYLLAAWFRVFGSGEAQVRLFGMMCALLQGVIVLAILGTIFGKAAASRWAPWFWAMFLLNPYTIQTAAIADIDPTIYGPLICAALLATLRLSWRDGVWRTDAITAAEYGWVSFALLLCFWAKLTTIVLVLPFVFFLLITRLGIRRAAIAATAMTASALGGFLATYWLYGMITGLDVGYTFGFTWMSFVQRGSSARPGLMARIGDHITNLRGMVPFMVTWIGLVPWLSATAVLACCTFIYARLRSRRALHYGLALLLAFSSTLYYCAKVFTFGAAPFKYVFVYWGLIVTSLLFILDRDVLKNGHSISRGRRSRPLIKYASLVLLYVAGAAWAMKVVRDSLILDGLNGPYRFVVVYAPAVLLLAGIVLYDRVRAGILLTISALVLYCAFQLGIGISQSRVDYATTYDYGQTGFMDTVAYLKLNTRPDQVIVSMKDIGYRCRRRYFENYGALYGDEASATRMLALIGGGTATYAVFTEGRGQDQLLMNPRVQQWVLKNCVLVASFGNYRIYQLAAAVAAQRAAACASMPMPAGSAASTVQNTR